MISSRILSLVFSGLLLLLFFSEGHSQVKFEKEERIKESEVPAKALSFIKECKFSAKVRWFKETNQDGTSFEAKVKTQNGLFSIEFSNTGILEDIEVTFAFEETLPHVRAEISKYLNSNFESHKVEKIQYQWLSGSEAVKKLFDFSGFNDLIPSANYEVVAETRKNGVYQQYEFLFGPKGEFLEQSRIVTRSIDLIEH